ncbi:MAG: hypothetical protein GQ564_19280 [Bacteroidales bacterium]|nr:hypothetical protein [Bacteroidales bacterium]
MKDLKNLKGAKMLSKMEQKAVKGGIKICGLIDNIFYECTGDDCCVNNVCYGLPSGMCA